MALKFLLSFVVLAAWHKIPNMTGHQAAKDGLWGLIAIATSVCVLTLFMIWMI